MTPEEKQNYVRIGLAILNIELHPEILRKTIEVIKIVDKKKGNTNIKDVLGIKYNQNQICESEVNKNYERNTKSR